MIERFDILSMSSASSWLLPFLCYTSLSSSLSGSCFSSYSIMNSRSLFWSSSSSCLFCWSRYIKAASPSPIFVIWAFFFVTFIILATVESKGVIVSFRISIFPFSFSMCECLTRVFSFCFSYSFCFWAISENVCMITAKNKFRRKNEPITMRIGKYMPAIKPDESM